MYRKRHRNVSEFVLLSFYRLLYWKISCFSLLFWANKEMAEEIKEMKASFFIRRSSFFCHMQILIVFFVYFSQTKRRIPKRREKKGTRSQKKSKNDQNFVWHKRYLCGFLATLPFLFDPDGYFLSTRWGKINPFQLCFSHKINVISFYRGIIWFWAFVTELQWRPSSPIL